MEIYLKIQLFNYRQSMRFLDNNLAIAREVRASLRPATVNGAGFEGKKQFMKTIIGVFGTVCFIILVVHSIGTILTKKK